MADYVGYAPQALWADFKVGIWSSNVNQNNNTSDINVNIVLQSKGGGYPYSTNQWLEFQVDGNRIFGGNVNYNVPRGGSQTIKQIRNHTITHNSDGSKQISFKAILNSHQGQCVCQGTFTLPTIPRSAGLTVPNEANFGDTITIGIDLKSSNHHAVIFRTFAGSTEVITANATGNYSWSIPKDLMYKVPSATSARMEISIETYNGDYMLGSTTKGITLKVPTWVTPDINSVTISDTVSGLDGYYQMLSKLRVKTEASGYYGSSIESVAVITSNAVYTGRDVTLPPLDASGNQEITVKITDSRGRTNYTTKTVDLKKYQPPTIALFDVTRRDGNETMADARVIATHTPFGSPDKNPMTVRIDCIEGEGKTGKLYDATSNVETHNVSPHLGSGYKSAGIYKFRLTISDKYYTRKTEMALGLATVSLDIGRTSLAVGMAGTIRDGIQSHGGYFDKDGNNILNGLATRSELWGVSNAMGPVVNRIDGIESKLGKTTGWEEVPLLNGASGSIKVRWFHGIPYIKFINFQEGYYGQYTKIATLPKSYVSMISDEIHITINNKTKIATVTVNPWQNIWVQKGIGNYTDLQAGGFTSQMIPLV